MTSRGQSPPPDGIAGASLVAPYLYTKTLRAFTETGFLEKERLRNYRVLARNSQKALGVSHPLLNGHIPGLNHGVKAVVSS